MTSDPMRLVVIVGSVREGRIGRKVADWAAGEARAHGGFDVELLDLADHDVSMCLVEDPPSPTREALADFSPRLGAADAFLVVTPEYNHSYPASLKNIIDWHFTEWAAKPIGLVSYGGMSGGLRAVEHLRPVFSELHATTVRDTVSFHRFSIDDHGPWDDFGGTDNHDAEALAGASNAAKVQLDQLAWWADALRTARSAHPYQT